MASITVLRESPRISYTLQALFPDGAIAAEMRSLGSVSDLLPAECERLGAAVPKRVGEFAAGRLCARRAMAELGIVDFPLIAAPDRQPVWPSDIVGSITHTAGFCAAVIAQKRLIRAIGLDSEGVGRVTEDIWDTICLPAELAWVTSLPHRQRHAAVTLVFSAKEAFYKCQYPMAGEWLDFADLRVEVPDWDAALPTFTVSATRPLSISGHAKPPWEGRYLFHEEFVTAGIALAHGDEG